MKKRRGPGFYIAGMLAQPLVLALSVVAGAWLDARMWKGLADEPRPGHPVPAFSVVLPLLALVVTAAVFLALLVGLILCLRRRRRGKKDLAAPASEWSFCPDCGERLSGTERCPRCGKRAEKTQKAP